MVMEHNVHLATPVLELQEDRPFRDKTSWTHPLCAYIAKGLALSLVFPAHTPIKWEYMGGGVHVDVVVELNRMTFKLNKSS